jgi:phospholipid/cholesterol/gamma-HCH transport system substrate-binding protein
MSVKNEIVVGIFFFTAMAILGYFTIIMSGEIFQRYEYYRVNVIFPSIEGLGVNDKVKVNGVLSGTVEDIQLRDNIVWVRLKMYIKFTLYENYKIRIKNETALGGKYVSIKPGSAILKGKYFAVIDIGQNLAGQTIEDPFGIISEFIEENKDNVRIAIRNIRDITEKINRGKGTLGKLVNEEKVHEDADDLIKELREAIEDTREQAPVTSFIRAALMAF